METQVPLHEKILQVAFQASPEKPIPLKVDDIYWKIEEPYLRIPEVKDALEWLLMQGDVEKDLGKYSLSRPKFFEMKAQMREEAEAAELERRAEEAKSVERTKKGEQVKEETAPVAPVKKRKTRTRKSAAKPKKRVRRSEKPRTQGEVDQSVPLRTELPEEQEGPVPLPRLEKAPVEPEFARNSEPEQAPIEPDLSSNSEPEGAVVKNAKTHVSEHDTSSVKNAPIGALGPDKATTEESSSGITCSEEGLIERTSKDNPGSDKAPIESTSIRTLSPENIPIEESASPVSSSEEAPEENPAADSIGTDESPTENTPTRTLDPPEPEVQPSPIASPAPPLASAPQKWLVTATLLGELALIIWNGIALLNTTQESGMAGITYRQNLQTLLLMWTGGLLGLLLFLLVFRRQAQSHAP